MNNVIADQNIINRIESAVKNGAKVNNWIRFAEYYRMHVNGGHYAAHYTSEDIVYGLLLDIMTGKRKWDIKKVPSIDIYVYHSIRSIVSRESSRKGNRCVSLDDCVDNGRNYLCYNNIYEEENKNYINETIEACTRLFDKDTECGVVFLEACNAMKNQEIAEKYGMTVRDVENAKKRIRRRLKMTSINFE